jgi:hypothetical protein
MIYKGLRRYMAIVALIFNSYFFVSANSRTASYIKYPLLFQTFKQILWVVYFTVVELISTTALYFLV